MTTLRSVSRKEIYREILERDDFPEPPPGPLAGRRSRVESIGWIVFGFSAALLAIAVGLWIGGRQ